RPHTRVAHHSFPTRRSSDLRSKENIRTQAAVLRPTPGSEVRKSIASSRGASASHDRSISVPLPRSASWIRGDLVTDRPPGRIARSEEHTSELQSRGHLVCRL